MKEIRKKFGYVYEGGGDFECGGINSVKCYRRGKIIIYLVINI